MLENHQTKNKEIRIVYNFYRSIRFIANKIVKFISQMITFTLFKMNQIEFKKGFISNGIPILSIQGTFCIGKNFKINNNINANPIGRTYKCMFVVRKNAKLIIGDNVGMSGTTIICQKKIIIGSNVKFGGNVCIYDTDFHTLDPVLRQNTETDMTNIVKKEVIIKNNVFIGAHSTILKGITIGENSIIGACSVVTKDIPKNQIWAGNPVKFIRGIDDNS